MASGTALFTNLGVIYNSKMRDTLIDQVALSSPLMYRLMQNKRLEGGGGVKIPLNYVRNTNIGTITPFADPNYVVPNTMAYAEEMYVTLSQNVAYSDLLRRMNEGTDEMLKATQYLADEVDRARNTMEYYISMMIFGDGSDIAVPDSGGRSISGFTGLRKIISTSNTVHGISQSTYSWWQAGATTALNSGTALSFANFILSTHAGYVFKVLRNLVGAASVNNNKPDLIVTTQIISDAYDTALGENKRMVNVTLGDHSFETLEFRGIPIVVDDLCPAGYGFALNTNHLAIAINPPGEFVMSEWEKRGDAHIASIDLDFALTCDMPRYQALFSDGPISYT